MQEIKNKFHLINAYLACWWYGFPGRKIKVIGVTGTDGKTTTTSLIYHILKNCNIKASMITTIYANIGGKIYDTGLHTTTPDPWSIQKYLAKAYSEGCEYFILETTSHALDQNRVWGIDFHSSVITNVTQEHLDYHKTFGNYLKAKAELLLNSKTCYINRDDDSFEELAKILSENNIKFKTYGLKNKSDFNWQKNTKTKLLGEINKYNILSAIAVLSDSNISDKDMKNAISSFESPKGRMEIAYKKAFTVIVDFAHTPNSIFNALQTIRQEYVNGQGRLIHVFGSAGKRDEGKRPMMGEASGRFSDLVILTEEDHRTERAELIIEQISYGLLRNGFKYLMPQVFKTTKEDKVYTSIIDREKAISLAIAMAKKGDVIAITGKSHEKSLCRGEVECPWDEFEAVKRAVKSKK
jgi:UDP-N-acetylmuramoyl-L-alanyl-D-glutamate--2,6-diaminopimelate ligase